MKRTRKLVTVAVLAVAMVVKRDPRAAHALSANTVWRRMRIFPEHLGLLF